MDLIVLDFETYYSQDFSLTKLTTEEYIRSAEFEVIGLAIKVNNNPTEWASGTHEQIKQWLHTFDYSDAMVLAHNTLFDGAILGWHFGIKPRVWGDTLCMGRALHGVEVGGSLAAMAQRYQVGVKGDEVVRAKGKRRADFTDTELSLYGDYCINDVDITYKLFNIMAKDFPKQELRLIDMTLRMFIEPTLGLNLDVLEDHLHDIKRIKEDLLELSGATKENLMSNPKFAGLLLEFGVQPPRKISLTTGKETWAFAKSDEGLKDLLEHEDVRIQALAAARVGSKSTLEETRTQRFIGIANRGLLPVPIRYYAAHTGRFGGDDKINMQNLASRGPNAKKLKRAICAPKDCVLIEADSSQIEARVLAWLAQDDMLVQAFALGKDVYKQMASSIYGVPEDQVTKEQRFIGKTTILGCGYGMGAVKFREQLRALSGVEMDDAEARRIIGVYRSTNTDIVDLWREAQHALACMAQRRTTIMGKPGVLEIMDFPAIKLPSGLLMRYDGLVAVESDKGLQFSYQVRRGMNKIYGGKVVENVCQAIARCIIAEQMLRVAKRYKVVMTVHDSIVCIAPESEVLTAQQYVEECMRWTPLWAAGLPVNCESGFAKTYGDC